MKTFVVISAVVIFLATTWWLSRHVVVGKKGYYFPGEGHFTLVESNWPTYVFSKDAQFYDGYVGRWFDYVPDSLVDKNGRCFKIWVFAVACTPISEESPRPTKLLAPPAVALMVANGMRRRVAAFIQSVESISPQDMRGFCDIALGNMWALLLSEATAIEAIVAVQEEDGEAVVFDSRTCGGCPLHGPVADGGGPFAADKRLLAFVDSEMDAVFKAVVQKE